MASLAAREVAKEVIGTLRRGQRPNITKIAMSKGYAFNTANTAQVQKTKSYKAVITPVVEALEKERIRVVEAMGGKSLKREQYRTLVDAQTKLTHDIQLLSGGKTENVGLEQERLMLLAIVKELKDGSVEPQQRIEA